MKHLRYGLFAFGFLAFAAGAATTTHAGSAATDSSAYGDYIQQLSREVTSFASSANGDGALAPLTVRFGATPDTSGLAAADQALVRAMGRTYDLFRALGGSTDRGAVVERADGRVYVGLDGEGGRWFADAAAAAAFLLSELVESSGDLPEPVREAVDSVSGDGCGVSCVAEAAFKELIATIAYVPRGTTVSLTLSADGFSDGNGTPVVEVPNGFVVNDVTYVDGSTVVAKLSVMSDAPTGRAIVSAFNAGSAFRAVDNFAIQVVDTVEQLDDDVSAPLLPGTGKIEALTDDHAGDVAEATTLAGNASGRIETTGDTDTFKIIVEQPGTLTISSSGGTDVRLTLTDGQGAVLGSDDDSAGWYNATLSRAVVVGTYFVRVTHCCDGTGSYSLAASLN